MITSGSGGSIVIVKVSVSRVPVASRTWSVKVKTPAVVGTPVIPPELTPWVNSLVPGGIRPSTTLNCTGFLDGLQPVVCTNQVLSAPTFPFTRESGTMAQFEGGAGAALAPGAVTRAAAARRTAVSVYSFYSSLEHTTTRSLTPCEPV